MWNSDIALFVKENWSEFETAIRKIIEDELGVEDGKDGVVVIQTEPSNDGGYDGLFCIPLSDSPEGMYRLLFEAKLRSNIKADLPLDSFSKSVIVAINRDVNALIVGTNLHLSQETKQRLDDFSKRTGLCIDYIEGMDMEIWIRGNPERKDIKVFSDILQHSIGPYKKEEILSATKNNMDIIRQNSGIIGQKRTVDFCSALSGLIESRKTVILKGARGTGKSFFANRLINSLPDNSTCIRLDLSVLHVTRTVFSTIVSTIWGIDENIILSMNSYELYNAVSRIGDNMIDSRVCDSVVNVFLKTDIEYAENASIFDHQLIIFLRELMTLVVRRRFLIIYISNSDTASVEMLNFVISLQHSISDCIPFIVEIRTGFISSVSSDAWDAYIKKLCSDQPRTSVYLLENWSEKDAKSYILNKIQIIDDAAINFILKQTDSNPIMICSYINYLNTTGLLTGVSPTLHERKLEELYIDDVTDIIQSLIESVCKSSEGSCDLSAKCLILISFSGGILKREYIEEILGCDIGEIRLAFSAEIVKLYDDEIRICHLIYQEVLERIRSKIMANSDIFLLAKKFYEYMNDGKSRDYSWYLIMIKLCRYLGKKNELLTHVLVFSKILFDKGQYHLCRDILEKLDFTGIENVLMSYNADLIDTYEMYLQLGFYLKERSGEEAIEDIERLESLVRKLRVIYVSDDRMRDQICRGFLIMARYEHSVGHFGKALDIMIDIRNYIENIPDLPECNTIYEVYTEYAIAVKEIDGIDSYIESLDYSLKKYPSAHSIRFLLNSAMYQKICLNSPVAAAVFVEDNEKLRDYLPISSILHNDVHRANSIFHMKKYEIARKYAEEYERFAGEYGLVNEIGRLENIIGCTYLNPDNEDTGKAAEHFRNGMKIYKSSTYYSYYWPILYNYVILSDYTGNRVEVTEYISELCDTLNKYSSLVNNCTEVTKHYVAYLCILRILKDYIKKYANVELYKICVKKLIKDVSNCELNKYANDPKRRFPGKSLSNSIFRHGKLYLITY